MLSFISGIFYLLPWTRKSYSSKGCTMIYCSTNVSKLQFTLQRNKQKKVEVWPKKTSIAREQIAQQISHFPHLSFWKSQQHSFLFLIPFHQLHSQECRPVMGWPLEVWHSKTHLLHGVWEQTIKGYREILHWLQNQPGPVCISASIVHIRYSIGMWQSHATHQWKDVLYPQGRTDILQGPGSHTSPLLTLWEAIQVVWRCLQPGWTAAWAPWCKTFYIYLQWRFQDGSKYYRFFFCFVFFKMNSNPPRSHCRVDSPRLHSCT